ncbi:MAG: histidine kinase [Clostridium sp.]|nr:histidine kinase [Clostridium sp.]
MIRIKDTMNHIKKSKRKPRKDKTFKQIIKKSFILYSLVPITIITLIFYGVFIIVFSVKSYNENKRVNSSISSALEEDFSKYEGDITKLSNDSHMINILCGKTSVDKESYETIYDMVNECKIKSIFNMYNAKGECILTSSTNDIIESKSNFSYIWNRFGKMAAKPDEIVMIPDKIQFDTNRRTIYTIGKAICDDEKNLIGFMEFDIIENEINNILSHKSDEDVIITDRYNNNIVNTNSALIDKIGKFKRNYYNESMQLIRKGILNDKIYVVTIKNNVFIEKYFITGGIILIFIFAIIFVVMIYAANEISTKNTKSIDELLKGLEYVQNGNFTQRLTINTNDEFKTVAEYYNIMIDKVKELIIKNEEEVKRATLAQLKHLESQFNPHFLFNTLEMLRYMIKTKDSKAEKVTLAMAGILRYSLDSNIRTTILKTDIKYIKDYLFIQKLRFGNKFDYEINIDERLENIIIPKLIIQPLIENSVKYGFDQKDSILIKIGVHKNNAQIIISVDDDGDGIRKEELQKIESILNEDNNESNHIGLYNVQKRIQLIYGDRYGIEVKSIEGKGTSILIRIPESGWSIND